MGGKGHFPWEEGILDRLGGPRGCEGLQRRKKIDRREKFNWLRTLIRPGREQLGGDNEGVPLFQADATGQYSASAETASKRRKKRVKRDWRGESWEGGEEKGVV